MRKLFDIGADEAAAILQALKAVVTAEGCVAFDERAHATLGALRDHVLRHDVDLDALPSASPTDLATAVRDPEVRANVVHIAVGLPFLDAESEIERAGAVRRLAQRFGVADRVVDDVEKAARKHYARISLDTMRGSIAELSNASLSRSVVFYLRSLLHADGDAALAGRVAAFERHTEPTVGRALLDYWRDNEFPRPGEKGSWQSRVFFGHDVHHVLSGYDTTPRGEFAVAGFITAMGEKDYADYTALLLLQLQVAAQVDPTVAAWRDQFVAEEYFAAMERGAACRRPLVGAGWDPWSLIEVPLAEARRSLGIPEAGAMVRAAGDRWCGAFGPPSRRMHPDRVVAPRY